MSIESKFRDLKAAHPTLTFKGKGRVKPAPDCRPPLKTGASQWRGQACSTLGTPAFPKTAATPCLLPVTRVSKKKKILISLNTARTRPPLRPPTPQCQSGHRLCRPDQASGRASRVSLLLSQPPEVSPQMQPEGSRRDPVFPAPTFRRDRKSVV